MGKFFTSDSHFGHQDIIKYCRRPYQTYWEMDKALIKNWNSVIGSEDEVYHLGDVAPYKEAGFIIDTIEQLNGRIYLINGNHDLEIFKSKWTKRLKGRFEWVKDYYEMEINDEETCKKYHLILFHYPILKWNRMEEGSWHLHGHCHGTLSKSNAEARLDVSIDASNYIPMSWDDIKHCMARKRRR